LIQQPHDNEQHKSDGLNICEKVTSQRIRRAIEGYTYQKPKRGGGEEKVRVEGLGGEFAYARLGPPLFGEYRDFGAEMPGYDQLARYVFYTETSRNADEKKFNRTTGLIGSTEAAGGTSYYLRYTPDRKEEGQEVSIATLKELLKSDKNKSWVIYCEKIWVHPDDLRQFQQEHHKSVRLMQVPFNLK
jgi:adenine-specific DNA-methyltransferase